MRNTRAIWLLLLANSISGVAQGISMLAIPWYFTGVIHNETLYGKVFMALTAISMFWGVYAGTLVDRYNRKNIFLAINAAGLLVMGSVAAYGFWQGGLQWPAVAVALGTTMFIYNIHFPNLYAFAHEITDKQHYGRVTSLLEIQGQVTFTAAGGLAAILLSGINGRLNLFGWQVAVPFTIEPWPIHQIFAIDAVTYIIALLIIYRIQSLPVVSKQPDLAPLTERLKAGVDFLKKHPLIFYFGNASLMVFLTIMVSSMYVLPVYVHSFLGQSGDVYAMADMVFSAGALLAGFLTNRLFGNKAAVQGIIILTALAGLMYAFMVFNKILVLFFAAQFVIGTCNAAVRILRVTYMFHHIPNRVIGRTGSVFFVVNVLLRFSLVGLFTLPFFHAGTQIVYGMVVMAVICFLAVLVLGRYYKALSNLPPQTE